MIARLASLSVCVIDDEEPDYLSILDALRRLSLRFLRVDRTQVEALAKILLSGSGLMFLDMLDSQSALNDGSKAGTVSETPPNL